MTEPGAAETWPTPLRVLLFSPLLGRDDPSGDTSYTDALLASPPAGVQYTSYAAALEDGSLRLVGRKPWRSGSKGWREVGVFGLRCIELALRKAGLLYREPTWFVELAEGRFDVVHQHLFSVAQYGNQVPVVSTAGAPLDVLYQTRECWSSRRTRAATYLERVLSSRSGAHIPWLRPGQGVCAMAVYTEHFRDWLIDRHVDPNLISVIGTGLADEAYASQTHLFQYRLGFIGRDFDRKGGPLAIEALQELRRRDPRWTLTAVTQHRAEHRTRATPGVSFLEGLDRQAVRTNVLPRIDILVCPTKFDCGVPYGILEALNRSIPVVTSDSPWLDNSLCGIGAHRVPPHPIHIADAVEMIAHQYASESEGARQLWNDSYELSHITSRLGALYHSVTDSSASPVQTLAMVMPSRDLVETTSDGFAVRHQQMLEFLRNIYNLILFVIPSAGESQQEISPNVRVLRLRRSAPVATGRISRIRCAVTAAAPQRKGRRVSLAAKNLQHACDVSQLPHFDAVLTMGPWISRAYSDWWSVAPSVHIFEEDLTAMREIAPQSAQARTLRAIEGLLFSLGPIQPGVVTYISPAERIKARQIFRGVPTAYLPQGLDEQRWPRFDFVSEGSDVLIVGNLSESRNADGVVAVLQALIRQGGIDGRRVRLVSGPGLDPRLSRLADGHDWITSVSGVENLVPLYRSSCVALVPALRVTGQKATILQAWSCGVPVITSPPAAQSVAARNDVLTATSPAGYVDAIRTLIADDSLRESLGTRGLGRAEEHRNGDIFRKIQYLVNVVVSENPHRKRNDSA